MKARDRIASAIGSSKFSGKFERGWTTHELATFCDCTPSYVRKVCKALFGQGRVCYKIEPHRGNSGMKRVWATIECGKKFPDVYVMPEYVQGELLL